MRLEDILEGQSSKMVVINLVCGDAKSLTLNLLILHLLIEKDESYEELDRLGREVIKALETWSSEIARIMELPDE